MSAVFIFYNNGKHKKHRPCSAKKQDKDGKVKCLSNYALTVKLINKISIIISVYIFKYSKSKINIPWSKRAVFGSERSTAYNIKKIIQ